MRTRQLRGARRVVRVAPLLALALALAGCGKYGPPRRVSPERDAQAAVGAGARGGAPLERAGSEALACEDPEAQEQP